MNKKRRCTHCKKYSPALDGIVAPIGFFCTQECRYNYATKQTTALLSKSKAITKKKERIALKRDLERVKPKSKLLSELQSLVNRYVRLRDNKEGCISCDKSSDWFGQWHASHYYSVGSSSFLRFNLWNIHKSCSVCNSHLSGNIGEYTPRLIDKIGRDKFDYLIENKSNNRKYDEAWIRRAIKIVKLKLKRLK